MFGQRQDGDEDLPGNSPAQSGAGGAGSAPPAKTSPAPQPAGAAPTAPVPSPKHKHSAYLTRIALQLGLSQADLDENPSSFIEQEVRHLREHLAAERQTAPRGPVAGSPGQSATLPTAASPPPPPSALDAVLADPSQWNAEFVELAQVARQAQAKLAELEGREKARTGQVVGDAIEAAFDVLPEAIYGKGGLLTLADPAQKQRRQAVYRLAGINQQVDSPRVIQQKIHAAHQAVYGGIVQPAVAAAADPAAASYAAGGNAPTPAAPARPTPPRDPQTGQFQPRISDDDWNQAGLVRPTARNGAAQPGGVHAAKTKVADYMRSNGLDPGPVGSASEDDDLPG